MRAGQLDRQVNLQSFALGTSGDPLAGTWTTEVANVWAGRLDAKGTERYTDGMVQAAEVTQAYKLRYNADILPTWRLVDGTEVWDIVAVLHGDRSRDAETVLLVRRLDPDDGG